MVHGWIVQCSVLPGNALCTVLHYPFGLLIRPLGSNAYLLYSPVQDRMKLAASYLHRRLQSY